VGGGGTEPSSVIDEKSAQLDETIVSHEAPATRGWVSGELAEHKQKLILWIVGTALAALLGSYWAGTQTAASLKADVREMLHDSKASSDTRIDDLTKRTAETERRINGVETRRR
jgi:hypothetical protein